jgi:hypothetical protein|uniref:Uncharacterized protein n=1 Tax=Siphoviridae sp. ctkfY9 TaxID=2823597 RepID=A0A8S5LD71_9CAUD|nr:MAG TPA: hypothetical protein [Siphoviridae sp. ctkfY9]
MTAITTLYKWFSDLMKPTGAQFKALIDSFWHKAEKIPISSIEGLDKLVEGTASARQLQNHINDTHAHKELLDKKVDKVPGKKLSTEDFTTELRQKLEGLRQVDISLLLPRGNFTGTAQDLKDLIDGLTRILQSPDTELDELREIVAYIKQNKHILSTLGINNIAGLEEALANKADKDHNHDDRYASITHHHNEYAHRTHRHNWDDIDGKPNNLATTENIKTAVEGIQIGGRNLLRETKEFIVNGQSNHMGFTWSNNAGEVIAERFNGNVIRKIKGDWQGIKANIPDILGEPVTISFWAKTNGKGNFGNYANKNKNPNQIENFTEYSNKSILINDNQWHRYTIFNPKGMCFGEESTNGFIEFYNVLGDIYYSSIKIEIGNKPTDWSPAPEDLATTEELMRKITRVGYEVGTDTVIPQAQQNDTIFVNASCTLGLQNIENLGSVSFIKTFDNGAVTFTCAGKNIIYPFDNTFNGKKGSTAVVSIHDNDCYIRISNV